MLAGWAPSRAREQGVRGLQGGGANGLRLELGEVWAERGIQSVNNQREARFSILQSEPEEWIRQK